MQASNEELDRVVNLCRAAGYDAKTCGRTIISKVCGITETAARRVQTTLRSGDIDTTPPAGSVPETPTITFDEALASYQKWIGMSGHVRTSAPRPTKEGREKIVIASDFHCPFHHKEAVAALIEEEAATADLLVIAGDIGDFWSTSRFPKNTRLTDPCSEMAETQALLTLLASKFKRVKLFGGNHDNRPKNFIASYLPPDVLDYIRLTGPMVFKPLEFMAAGLENVEIVEPLATGCAEFAFLHQIGDLVATHAETYSIIPNRATGNVNKWLHSFAIPAGIISGPVRAVVQGHTHQGGSVLGDYGVLCIENGCMSQLQDYHGTAKIMTPRPLAQGWSVVYQEHGRTSHRDSRFIPFKH